MTTITIEAIESKHAEVAALIERFKKQRDVVTTRLVVPAAEIALRQGERYAGAVLNDDGTVKHHLVLLAARPEVDVNWSASKVWAEKAGGSLPDRQEQALLFANCKAALPQRWCWSSEAEGSSYAWLCYFTSGFQNFSFTSYEGCAVAVRRLNP